MREKSLKEKADENCEDGEGLRKHMVHVSKYGTTDEFKLDESGAVSGISCFEDLLELINPLGRWNVMTMLLMCLSGFAHPLNTVTYQFIGTTPGYWCHVEALTEANWTQEQIRNLAIPINSNDTNEKHCKFFNYDYDKAVELGYEAAMENRDSITIGDGGTIYCQSRDFNVSHYSLTVVAEWDLVCERRALYSTTQSASQIGMLLGALVFGYAMDKYGRRPIVLLCIILSLISSLGAAASPGITLYVILRISVSFFNVGYFTGCFIYKMEMCSNSMRSYIGGFGGMGWSFGVMAVPGIAYLIRPWRWLQVAYSIPTLFLFSYYWFMPESPRWLISQGRYEQVIEIFTRAAKVSGRVLPPSEALIKSMRKMTPVTEAKNPEKLSKRIIANVRHFLILLIQKEHRINILISYFCWCAVSMVYYGVALNSGNLSTDPYLYVFLGGVIDMPAYLLKWVLIYRLGRRIGLMICYSVCCLTISLIAILLATQEEVSFSLLMFLSLTGKLFIGTAFGIVYVYSAELFPTRYRSLAVCESSMMARVGSISSPYINDILGDAITWGPSALFAVMSAAAASLCLFLPETRDAITEEKAELSGDQNWVTKEKMELSEMTSGTQDNSASRPQMKNPKTNEAFVAD